MTTWLPDLARRPGPRYVALAEAIAQDVADGTLADRPPPAAAARSGLPAGGHGRHGQPRLRDRRPARAGQPARSAAAPTCAPRPAAPGRPDPVGDGDDALIKLTVNAPPDPSYRALLAQGLGEIGRAPARSTTCCRYTPKRGFADHRAAAAAWIGRVGRRRRRPSRS